VEHPQLSPLHSGSHEHTPHLSRPTTQPECNSHPQLRMTPLRPGTYITTALHTDNMVSIPSTITNVYPLRGPAPQQSSPQTLFNAADPVQVSAQAVVRAERTEAALAVFSTPPGITLAFCAQRTEIPSLSEHPPVTPPPSTKREWEENTASLRAASTLSKIPPEIISTPITTYYCCKYNNNNNNPQPQPITQPWNPQHNTPAQHPHHHRLHPPPTNHRSRSCPDRNTTRSARFPGTATANTNSPQSQLRGARTLKCTGTRHTRWSPHTCPPHQRTGLCWVSVHVERGYEEGAG